MQLKLKQRSPSSTKLLIYEYIFECIQIKYLYHFVLAFGKWLSDCPQTCWASPWNLKSTQPRYSGGGSPFYWGLPQFADLRLEMVIRRSEFLPASKKNPQWITFSSPHLSAFTQHHPLL